MRDVGTIAAALFLKLYDGKDRTMLADIVATCANEAVAVRRAELDAVDGVKPDPATTSKIVRLHDGQPQPEPGVPSQGLIGALTQTLELAQSGRLQALWGTGFTSDGLRFVVKGGRHEDVYQFAGALAFLGDEYRDEVLTKHKED